MWKSEVDPNLNAMKLRSYPNLKKQSIKPLRDSLLNHVEDTTNILKPKLRLKLL